MFRKIEPMQERNEAHQEEHQENPKVLRRAIQKREITLEIYVFDKRSITTTPKQIIAACHDTRSHLHLCIIFDEYNETYHINESNSSPTILRLGLPMHFSSLKVLQRYFDVLAVALHRKAHAIIKQVRLACPGNLGADESTLLSSDVDRLVSALRPDELLFFIFENEHLPKDKIYRLCFDNPPDGILEATDDAVRVFNLPLSAESGEFSARGHHKERQPSLDQEISTYYQRNFTQMNYQIPNSVTFGAWIHVSDILLHLELLKTKKYSSESSNVIKLIKLRPPLSLHEERTLAVYLVSREHDSWDNLAMIGSIRHHEPCLFVVYDQESVYDTEKDISEQKETYEILQCNFIHPAPKVRENARMSTLTSIDPPLMPLTERHFIEYLQVLKSPEYVNYLKLRLCLEANFADDAQVAAIVSRLVNRLLPDYLAIIHTERSEHDAQNYLKRLTTAAGFSLPLKKMKGNCISEKIILRALSQTKTSKSPLKKQDVSSFNSNHSTLNCEPPVVEQENNNSIYIEIDQCLESNIIPEPLTPEEQQMGLSTRSITQISLSNKGFSLFRPRAPDQNKTASVTFGMSTITTYEDPADSQCCTIS